MMSTAGMTTVYSTLKVDATLKLSVLTKNLNRISITQSEEMLFLRTLLLQRDGKIDFNDKSVTENTRVSYPISHINNIEREVNGVSAGPADIDNVIFFISRCVRRTSSSIYPDTRTDTVLLLSGFTAKTCWYRAWNHRANTHILSLLWTGILRVASYKIRRRAC